MAETLPEVWLRGPVDGIPSLLQPAAHALLQAVEEIKTLLKDFPDALLWERPAGVASPGFHLLHISGVLDRLGAYAKGEQLSSDQLAYLKKESEPQEHSVGELIAKLEESVQRTLQQLKSTDESSLTNVRTVGRKALPSTVQGLLFHAAEHTMRHLGQLLVTVRVLKAIKSKG
ncbi:DinB family protein [Flavisolibacter ginsenosidimutans]|uniref:DinB family protein n=1 Tax=Flavisolibacter ginsenosidimutans TaxID=661481 RepID=A0A5B8UKA9_9BACT|nr:DinB family protein [Flavisolibacter ginsenosidimutans]QEC57114.1 DinB family protein [Flavisolibacter ginsenosidimutans]